MGTVAFATPQFLAQPTRQQSTRPDTGMPRHTLQMMPSHTLLLTISSLLIITDSYSLRPPLLAYRGPRPTLLLVPARNRCAACSFRLPAWPAGPSRDASHPSSWCNSCCTESAGVS